MPLSFQLADQKRPVDRGKHVWTQKSGGKWKCVLCGAVAAQPSDHDEATAYESLTDEERRMCPQREGRHLP